MSKGSGLEPVFDKHGDFVGRIKLGHHKKPSGTPWLMLILVALIGVAVVFAVGGVGMRAPGDGSGGSPPETAVRP